MAVTLRVAGLDGVRPTIPAHEPMLAASERSWHKRAGSRRKAETGSSVLYFLPLRTARNLVRVLHQQILRLTLCWNTARRQRSVVQDLKDKGYSYWHRARLAPEQ